MGIITARPELKPSPVIAHKDYDRRLFIVIKYRINNLQ